MCETNLVILVGSSKGRPSIVLVDGDNEAIMVTNDPYYEIVEFQKLDFIEYTQVLNSSNAILLKLYGLDLQYVDTTIGVTLNFDFLRRCYDHFVQEDDFDRPCLSYQRISQGHTLEKILTIFATCFSYGYIITPDLYTLHLTDTYQKRSMTKLLPRFNRLIRAYARGDYSTYSTNDYAAKIFRKIYARKSSSDDAVIN